ncbi:MAG: hypothetical protein H7101_11075, partial [Deinococcales bacterium]|nr:hypothetical protein [Chitinophagaceae bacterium]
YLQKQGVTDFIFSLGYLHQQVVDFLKTEFPTLVYVTVIEQEPMGTGGAIALCLPFCKNDTIILVNGDTFFDLHIGNFYKDFIKNNSDCSIALTPMQHFDRYGSVTISSDNLITEFIEKKYCEKGLINTGLVLVKTEVFKNNIKNLPPKFSLEKDFIEPNISTLKITGYIASGYFIDIGIPEDFKKAQLEIGHLII